jgi:hypothetical protein
VLAVPVPALHRSGSAWIELPYHLRGDHIGLEFLTGARHCRAPDALGLDVGDVQGPVVEREIALEASVTVITAMADNADDVMAW